MIVSVGQGASKVCSAAEAYYRDGLSVIPVKADGSKAPALPGGDAVLNRKRRATPEELGRYFANNGVGVGICCGPVSGCLNVLDFEYTDIYEEWVDLVRAEAPGLLEKL